MAEARILVRPDTTAFRGLLEAELRASLAKPVTVPVTPVIVGGTGQTGAFTSAQVEAAAATQGLAAALEAETISANKATVSTKGLAAAQTASATAAQKLAFSQTEVIGASSAVSAAQITLTRSTAAVVAAQKAVGLALASNNAELIVAETRTLELAQAQQLAATTALSDARAEAALAATRAQATKGIIAQGAATLGLRAGTLAASSSFIVATVGVLGFVKAVQSAASLETGLNVFAANAEATADQMERVSAAAKDLGRDITLPGVTAGTAATAMTELAKAGLSVEESIAGARGALQLATAAQVDITTSTKLVVNTLNAFGLAGKDAIVVADLLAGASSSAQGEIGEFGTALGQVASVADQFGVSAGDTVTLLTQLAKAGLQGGRAGTTLRVAILGLIKPTAAAAVELKKLEKAGVEVFKPNGAFNPTAFAQINEALKRYSKEQQSVVRNTIFSSDAIKVLGRATAGGVEDFKAINAEVTAAGEAQKLAAARTEGFAGSVENLSNQMEGLGTTLGGLVLGPLGATADFFANFASRLNDSIDAILNLKKNSEFGKEDSRVRSFTAAWEGLVRVGDRVPDFTIGGLDKVGLLVNYRNEVKKTSDELLNLKEVLDLIDEAGTFGLTKLTEAASVPDVGLGVKQIQNIITGFNAQEVRTKIAGDNAKLLDVLKTEEAFFERQLTRDYVKRRPALQRAIEIALLGATTQIESVLAKGKADTEKIKRDAEQAAQDRQQALLAGQATARDKQKNLITTAEQTPGLQDDLKRQEQLRQLILRQIAAVRKQIKDEGAKAAAIAALDAVLIQVKGAISGLKERQKEIREEQRQALLQGIDLDISLAQITDNQRAEVAARNKKIAELNKDLAAEAKLHGKTTVAYKTIRNEIAAQNAALDELNKEKKKNNAFAQASFDFLQAQQGFASNLLGNLIPSGATGGLVGGGSVPSALAPVSGFADGQSKSGPTAGQAQTTNAILTGILNQLKELNGETKAPEARRQYSHQYATMDGVGGG